MDGSTVWDIMTFLWESALGFLDNRIDILGLNFTLWQFALGIAVVDLLLYAIFRCLD